MFRSTGPSYTLITMIFRREKTMERVYQVWVGWEPYSKSFEVDSRALRAECSMVGMFAKLDSALMDPAQEFSVERKWRRMRVGTLEALAGARRSREFERACPPLVSRYQLPIHHPKRQKTSCRSFQRSPVRNHPSLERLLPANTP